MAKCRFCDSELKTTFVDLGMTPLANAYVKKAVANNKENYYPLHAYVCTNCFLVQLEEFETPANIFRDYQYLSSFSQSWLNHAANFVDKMVSEYDIGSNSQVIEIASNDGYLLQYFKKKNIAALGIEPAENAAKLAREKGIATITDFFSTELAYRLVKSGTKADLLIGNNVLAHVPDINDFIKGLNIMLKEDGFITLEFPHLLNLIKYNQFDTIYHEHFSYLSLLTLDRIFEQHGLTIFNLEKLPTHGGSLRVYLKHTTNQRRVAKIVQEVKGEEIRAGLKQIKTYTGFNEIVKQCKRNILKFLCQLKDAEKKIVAYGAAAKGNTLFNYCGIGYDFIDFVVDTSPYKQGYLLPGSRLEIRNPEDIKQAKPDYVIIIPWNLTAEISEQLQFIKTWGGKFITLIPELRVW